MIEHANIIWLRMIDALGGLETYVFELVKKYKDLDIAVVCKYCDPTQKKRLSKYCRVYTHTNQKINCKVCITNYDISIIPYLNEDAKVYETIHGDYTSGVYDHGPATDDRITGYIAITHYLEKRMVEMNILPKDKVVFSYNPMTIEQEEKPIIIVSATRLHRTKGKDRMQKLATALDNAGVNYIWYVFTNERTGIDSPNVIFLKNRLDISKWLVNATYVCLLSDTEADSYTLKEGTYRNIPLICTRLPYLEEIGIKDGVNAYIMEFDCSNIDDIVKKITTVPRFKYEPLKDSYDKILAKSKSRYEEEKEMQVKVKCIMENGYDDMELGKHIKCGDEFIVDQLRAEYLRDNKAVEILEEIKEEKEIIDSDGHTEEDFKGESVEAPKEKPKAKKSKK